MKHKGLNQLLCAATVNNGFRETLLHNPAQAIATGYFDHTFSLTPEERDLIISIQAQKLEDFAAQVYRWISGYGNGNGNGHRQKTRVTAEPFVDLYNARAPVAA
jgi:hypothetical protein